MPADLRALHDEMSTALAELDRLTASDSPDHIAIPAARLRLSRASGRRRRLVDAMTTRLLGSVSPADSDRLRALREINAAQLHASTSHIGKWGMRHALEDWAGYCEASKRMRQSLRDLMAEDRRTLYPLLDRKAP
ncbi:hypothetical protein [Sphingomonas sp.]|jgi:hypothetical protein|uniref:hypothetical protein n=1 Tax=Sphingomonas sp. TaxID=28214 RepID=UPI002EDB002C